MTGIAEFGIPTRIYFGIGARNRIADIIAARGFRRVLFICDPALLEGAMYEAVIQNLQGVETTLFSGIDPEPKDKNVVAGSDTSPAHGPAAADHRDTADGRDRLGSVGRRRDLRHSA